MVALPPPQPGCDCEREAHDGVDPDPRAFASRTLLALREHLAMAEQAAAVAARQDQGHRAAIILKGEQRCD